MTNFHLTHMESNMQNSGVKILRGFHCLCLLLVGPLIRSSYGQAYPGLSVYQQPQQPYYPNPYNPNSNPTLGSRDYGDECQLTQPSILLSADESRMCDASRGLVCTLAQRCACYVPGAIYRQGRCRARVGKHCVGNDGKTIECVRDAECNTATTKCQCRRNYWSNDEGTACNDGRSSLKLNSMVYLCVLSLIQVIFINYLS